MEHRKRKMNQQKVEISTLLRMIMTKSRSKKFRHEAKTSRSLTKSLAFEAIESLKDSDQCGSRTHMRELEHVIEIF